MYLQIICVWVPERQIAAKELKEFAQMITFVEGIVKIIGIVINILK